MSHYDILLYHGVYDAKLDTGPRNRSGKHISSDRFRAEMHHLARTRPLVSMADIAAAHTGGQPLPENAVAISFDDGFLNNYLQAWPILEEFGVPATIYVATGFIGTGRMVWSDRLENAFLDTGLDALDIAIGNIRLNYPLTNTNERVAAFLDVKAQCKRLPNDAKDSVIETVAQALGASPSSDHPLYAFMDWQHIREMNKSDLISFGAHTIDHISLAKVAETEMRRQIDTSVRRLADELGEPSPFFSYPEGQSHDYNDAVIAYLRQRGFDHCPTAIDGGNDTTTTDPFHIRRIMVGFEGRTYPFADADELGYTA